MLDVDAGSGERSAAERRLALEAWRAAKTVGRLSVVGGSMKPLLNEPSTVRVQGGVPARFGDIVVGDTPDGLVVHRVVSRGLGAVRLRGDATGATDAPLEESRLLGRVIAVEGIDGRRLDRGFTQWLGVGAAGYARIQMVAGDRPRRPRPAAIVSTGLAVQRRAISPMPPEDRLLLYLARIDVSEHARKKVRALLEAGCIDWELVSRRALSAQLGPLVYRSLHELHDLEIPEAARTLLRRQAVGAQLRSFEVAAMATDMLERLDASGIPVLVHKGLALAATVYPQPALRISGDIDLSVRDADRPRAEALLADIREALVDANPDRRGPAGHHVELDGTAHHDVDPSKFGRGRWTAQPLDWEGIWARAESHPIAGSRGLVPSPTDLLVTVVANSIRRGFSPVRVVADVAATVHRHAAAIDWGTFDAAVRTARLDSRSWIALELAADWFGADVPARLLEPPPDLRIASYERVLLAAKRRRPFMRLPTGALWAGSHAAAAAAIWRAARHRRGTRASESARVPFRLSR